VERNAGNDRPAARQRDPLVQLDELRQRQQRMPRIPLHLGRAGHVAEHERVRRRAVDEAEGDARVGRVRERALALDEEQLSPALVPLDDELLGRAREEVRDHRIDGDAPAGDRDTGLPRGHEDGAQAACARCPVEREGDRHLPDRAVRADGEHDLRRHLEIRAGRNAQLGRRAAQVAQLDAVARGELGQLGVVGQELVQAVLDVPALADAGLQELAPGRREAAALGGHAHERGRRVEAEGLVDGADDRDAGMGLPRPARVEDGDDVVAAVAEDAAHRLPVVRVVRESLSEYEQPSHAPRGRARLPGPARRR